MPKRVRRKRQEKNPGTAEGERGTHTHCTHGGRISGVSHAAFKQTYKTTGVKYALLFSCFCITERE